MISKPSLLHTVIVKRRFRAERRLPNVPSGHVCGRQKSYDFCVEMMVSGQLQQPVGWVVDYAVVEEACAPIISQLDQSYLNDITGLDNPTNEHMAEWIWQKLQPALLSLTRITLWETDDRGCMVSMINQF